MAPEQRSGHPPEHSLVKSAVAMARRAAQTTSFVLLLMLYLDVTGAHDGCDAASLRMLA